MVEPSIFRAPEGKSPSEVRSAFAIERDRMMYSKDYRRLALKTQVFVSGYDDHMRSRLSHTLEVVQLAETVSQNLGLNTNLCNAIAVGHDLGHAPFGHAGERTLNRILNGCYEINHFNRVLSKNDRGFKHNWQSVRVCVDLNTQYDGSWGLGLSGETLWGIANHTSLRYRKCERLAATPGPCGTYLHADKECKREGDLSVGFYEAKYPEVIDNSHGTMEALVVRIADEIAQRHHDLEDGLIAGLVKPSELVELIDSVFHDLLTVKDKGLLKVIEEQKNGLTQLLKAFSHLIIDLYIRNVIASGQQQLAAITETYSLGSTEDFSTKRRQIFDENSAILGFSPAFEVADEQLKQELKHRILNSQMAQMMDSKAERLITKLFEAYTLYPQHMPDRTLAALLRHLPECEGLDDETLARRARSMLSHVHNKNWPDGDYSKVLVRHVCDFIAGMTDDFAYGQYKLIYGQDKVQNNAFRI